MKEKISRFLHGELLSSIIFVIMGLLLSIFPAESINVICKLVFGILLLGTGIYYIVNYINAQKNTTMLDMFTGVIVLVLGAFLFTHPQIVIKVLPHLFGALVIVDVVWIFRAARWLRKNNLEEWKAYLFDCLVFVILGIIMIINPFQKIQQTIVFAGIVFIVNGVADIVFYVIRSKKEKALTAPAAEETAPQEALVPANYEGYEEYDPTYASRQESVEPMAESESAADFATVQDTPETASQATAETPLQGEFVNEENVPEEEPQPEAAPESEAFSTEVSQSTLENSETEEPEVLEEWKDET